MSSVLRYLKLYGYFVRFSIMRSMAFRFDFWFRIVMDVIFYLTNIAFYKILLFHSPEIGGWNEHQAMIFVAGFLLMDAVQMTFVSNNLWWLPFFINRGDLDYYLLRPVSSLFFLSLREFAANSMVNLIMALGLLIWAIHDYPGSFTVSQYFLYTVTFGMGTFLFYALRMFAIIPVFWTQSSRGFDQLNWVLAKCAEKPDRIFRGLARKILLTVLPYGLMVSFPSRLFFETFDWKILIHQVTVFFIFVFLLNWAWKKGIASYSSASS